ncbi:hypothetical protein [Virgibacillus halodenitrificans]|uniref:Phage portal protein n=1 Tax=Virgibacillus halodenitrificans TaxID=1482 RepID=A0ABR7VMY2_VIRHA|nr:hypothetical protein [Virgibacillus halodenitrificans]MBD1223260.1 hypothetical protein [Virgibacillus halodenitrificans]
MSEQNQLAEKQDNQEFSTMLTKVNNTYFPMIERQLVNNGLNMDEYSKRCVLSAITSINEALDKQGITWNNPQLDQSNITQNLLQIASLKLNAAASPNEVYFQVRNVKRKVNGKDEWKKQIEMGIEGDGNDAILARFGRNVEQVMQHWLVREEDSFTYPGFNGLEMTPPTWQPTGKGEVIRVVYPIKKTDGTVDFHITEREDVLKNLIAHVNNNMMNETFGIAKSRFDATPDQKKKIATKKQEIINKVKEQGLMKSLDDPELNPYISPAWRDPQSRESMIIRKMRNNIVKKIPKDFGNAFIGMNYDEATDETQRQARKEINENANKEYLDFEEQPKQEQPPKNVNRETGEIEDIEYKEIPDQKEKEEVGQTTPTEPVVENKQQTTLEGPGF